MSSRPQNGMNHGGHGRRRSLRPVLDRVLIVTEGARTEPAYFKHLINKLNINSKFTLIDYPHEAQRFIPIRCGYPRQERT